MNILDLINNALGMNGVKLGFMPDKPDSMIALFEYESTPPEHSFNCTDIIHNVQARVRDVNASSAYKTAVKVAGILNRYHDNNISVLQSTPIIDIGKDNANPPRHEYTVNFIIRRY